MQIGFVLKYVRNDQSAIIEKAAQIIKLATELGFTMDSMSCIGLEKQMKLQMEIDQSAATYQIFTNIMKKLKEIEDDIIKHMK